MSARLTAWLIAACLVLFVVGATWAADVSIGPNISIDSNAALTIQQTPTGYYLKPTCSGGKKPLVTWVNQNWVLHIEIRCPK